MKIRIFTLLLLACPATIVSMEDPSSTHKELLPAQPEGSIRILTYNIRRKGKEKEPEQLWDNRKERVFALIKQINPDLIGLQEPTIEQINDLADHFPTYAWFGKGRGSSWMGMGTNEYNPILYKKEMFELIEHGTFSINTVEGKILPFWTPLDRSKTGMLPRICTWGKFKHKESNREFCLYNTHFDHQFETAQLNNANNIKTHIAKQTQSSVPLFLTGDLNTSFEGKLKQALGEFESTRDKATTKNGPTETRTGWQDDELKEIDYILIKKDSLIKAQQHTVLQEEQPYSSDHRPVFVDFEFVEKTE